jgi:hypothetical protein
MKSRYLADWLKTCDPIHQGWTLGGIAGGLCMTGGLFYPRVSGGYNLYRRIGGIPDPTSELVGAAGSGATTVQTFPWVFHAPGCEYHYRLVPVGGGGIENWSDVTGTRVVFDAAGDWVGTLPNAPSDLRMETLARGRFSVQWTYLPQGQEAEPAGFHVYTSEGGDAVDYGSVYASVPYVRGRIHYGHVTDPLPDGQRVGWAVRAFSASFQEEQNTSQVFGEARNRPPAVNPVVMISVV